MEQKKCEGDHGEHICNLASQGKHLQIKQVVQNPNYMCANCGRVADTENNLCNPVSFAKITSDLEMVR